LRLKTYSAATGEVYEYVFRAQQGSTYRFDVSADRREFRAMVVELDRRSIERVVGRELSGPEERAVATLALRLALDEGCLSPFAPVAEQLRAVAEALGL
jgi:hypothetical protein